jgi:hypothetical protein
MTDVVYLNASDWDKINGKCERSGQATVDVEMYSMNDG